MNKYFSRKFTKSYKNSEGLCHLSHNPLTAFAAQCVGISTLGGCGKGGKAPLPLAQETQYLTVRGRPPAFLFPLNFELQRLNSGSMAGRSRTPFLYPTLTQRAKFYP